LELELKNKFMEKKKDVSITLYPSANCH